MASSVMRVLSGIAFDGILLVDDDRRYVRINAPGAAILGASREQVLSRSIDDYTSAQFEHLLPDLWSTLERNGVLRGAYEVLRGDGTIGMIEFAAQRDLFPGQHLIVARDLPRNGNVTRAVGFALADPATGDIEEASPECCRLVGRSRNVLRAAGLRVFGGKRQSEDTIAAMRAIVAGTQVAHAFRCLVRRPDGGVQRLAVTLRPVLGAELRAVRILFEVAALASAPLEPVSPLSPRECEVLQLTADGGTAASIAEQLFLSPGTVRTHQRNIFAKLRVHDRAAAVAEGMRRGLID